MTPIAASESFVPAGLWIVDAEASSVEFAIKHLKFVTVHGRLGGLAGVVNANDQFVHAEGTVEVATIDTGDAIRDERLRGPEFFDAEQYPEIRFHATNGHAVRDGGWTVTGDLTIAGRTHPATFTARAAERQDGAVITATASLSRAEHGLDWPALTFHGRDVVGDRIDVKLRLVLH